MKILDPHLKDGVHEWRDGKRFVKEGVKLYLEGTDTLAGRYVPEHPQLHPYQPLAASASSRWTHASATSRVSQDVLWAKRLNARRIIRLGVSVLRIGKARSAQARMRTWSFLTAAALCLARGLGERKSGRKRMCRVLCMYCITVCETETKSHCSRLWLFES
jgi:hypothetical protein